MLADPARLTVVVDDGADALAGLVVDALRQRRRPVMQVESPRLGLLDVHVADGRVEVEGEPLGAVLFRATPWNRHDAGYVDEDASFASAEVAATWLAITRLPGVTAINRLHPEASVTFSEWPVWWRSLEATDVAQPAIGVGDVDLPGATWFPWGGGIARVPGTAVRRRFAAAMVQADIAESGVWLDGALLAGIHSDDARAAAACLANEGIRLAGISVDRQGRVAQATARPIIGDGDAPDAADRVAEALMT